MDVDYGVCAGYGFELTYEVLEPIAKNKIDNEIADDPSSFKDWISGDEIDYEGVFNSEGLDFILEGTKGIYYNTGGNAYSGDEQYYFLVRPENCEDLLKEIDEAIDNFKKYDIYLTRLDFKFICEGRVY